jgi:hypothetical protein
MALPIFQRTVVNSTGDILPNAQVTVREAGTQTLATIYQDEGGLTPKSNPFLTDSSGLARFYAAPQVVDVAVTAASGAISWIDIQLIDTQDITTIGSNFAAVETVSDNISSVISVLDNIENIDTVADNIADVNATGSNIAAVIDAPNQAGIATTQAGIATTQANNASSSASTATTQAGIATTQSGIATTQAGIATTKASEAAASAASVNANNIVHAPNSGLPNELSVAANSVYGKSNILGTVSQSSGVPTGAIIERGSNANGQFVKYADGTMICTFDPGIGNFDWTIGNVRRFQSFAATFTDVPSVYVGFSSSSIPQQWDRYQSFIIMAGSNSQWGYVVRGNFTESVQTPIFGAIGKWI